MDKTQKNISRPTVIDLSAEEIADTLVHLLSSGQARAGMRLRSLRDLAETFSTEYRRVRSAIVSLTERGILAKRQGSGTFIRRLPGAADAGKPNPVSRKLKVEQVLSIHDDARSRRRPLAQHRHLDFQIWMDLHWPSPVQTSILAGATEVLSLLGHRITSCGGTESQGVALDKRKLEKILRANPADGFLVLDWLSDHFGSQFSEAGKLWLTFGFSGPIRHQPGMILDSMEAAERGTRALIEGGCRRVALLGYFDVARDCDFERFYYTHALRHAGIEDYNVAEFVALDRAKVQHALAGMLDAHLPPDGIYVADDNLLPFVAEELEQRNLVPGRDLGIVTLWNDTHSLDDGMDWSRMEHSPRKFGRALAHNLVAAAQSANAQLTNSATLAEWKPGKTHLRTPFA
ncbi:MAG: GntR family transcriptional regulator [Terrimicrobiaceae bacterium]